MKIISFTAVWCPVCIVMKNRWEKIRSELPWLDWTDFDFDRETEKLREYNIGRDIPVFIFLDSAGKEFARRQGEIDRKDLIKFLEENKDR
ncbi:MAG: thioredoxin family protein [Candidatus Buchananbacteria bacterium]